MRARAGHNAAAPRLRPPCRQTAVFTHPPAFVERLEGGRGLVGSELAEAIDLRHALTGLRIGEMLGLRWRALDLTNGTLRVLESAFEGQRQRPKAQRALRTIPLGPHAVQVLTDHRQRSTRTGPDDLVFPNRTGEPLRESKLLTRVLQPAAERAGLGRVTWHQFRHVHSSLLNDLGVQVKIAQEQLGHASVQTTLNIYTHVVDGSHRPAIEQLERRLFPSVPKSQEGDNSGKVAKTLTVGATGAETVREGPV